MTPLSPLFLEIKIISRNSQNHPIKIIRHPHPEVKINFASEPD